MLKYTGLKRSLLSKLLTLSVPLLASAVALAETELSPFLVHSNEPHQVQVINMGVAGFEKRLQMIEKAQTFIDVEYFIYYADEAGRIFTQALLKKKQQNPQIKIRILVDGSPTVLELEKLYVTELAGHGIEVRHYNPESVLHVVKTQYRDHRKLLLVDTQDGLEAITGGRNIADEYFDMNPKLNFIDRDLWVKGPITQEISQSFEEYWNDHRTKIVDIKIDPPVVERYKNYDQYQVAVDSYNREVRKVKRFVTENDHDRKIRLEISEKATAFLNDPNSQGACGKMTYITDQPGFDVDKNSDSPKREVLKALLSRIDQIPNGGEFTAESPYFILHDSQPTLELESFETRNITSTLLTNSLNSTDAFYVAANFIPKAHFYEHASHAKIYLYSGEQPKHSTWISDAEDKIPKKNALWGIHAKTYVFGQDSFAISTFNLDPRSANLNNEMMLICDENQQLTDFVLESIYSRTQQSRQLSKDGRSAGRKDFLNGASLMKKIEFFLSLAPAAVLESLM